MPEPRFSNWGLSGTCTIQGAAQDRLRSGLVEKPQERMRLATSSHSVCFISARITMPPGLLAVNALSEANFTRCEARKATSFLSPCFRIFART
eukprot:UN03475